ncbi:MAG: DUF4362 domain-containing protein [Ilumatobacter sp.]|nr:DUF4362 domain-containing protein [Ilumatobacter sp.]
MTTTTTTTTTLSSVGAALLLAACGGGSGSGSLVFGAGADTCEPTVLTNDVDDERLAAEGSACFVAEVEAGRAVIWDVIIPTVEGDPIVRRYDFDGETTVITTDSSRDEFGGADSGVGAQRCADVRLDDRLPEGVDCEPTDAVGFDSAGLP